MATYNFTIGTYPKKPSLNIKILTGQRFGRLLVIGFAGCSKRSQTMWHCLCECGNGCTVHSGNLTKHHTTSCGCYRDEASKQRASTHGDRQSAEYLAYTAAKSRCEYQGSSSYQEYGKRGIEFRFASYPEFLAEVGRKPTPKHSLDRFPNNKDGHYEKGNVRWATKKEQARNTRRNHLITMNDKTQCRLEWCEELGLNYHSVSTRIHQGWCDICALTVPKYGKKCSHIVQN